MYVYIDFFYQSKKYFVLGVLKVLREGKTIF